MQGNTQPQTNMTTAPNMATNVGNVAMPQMQQSTVGMNANVNASVNAGPTVNRVNVPTGQGQTSVKTTAARQATEASTPTVLPTSIKIETLLEACIKRNASDLHIQVGLPPVLRIDGALSPIPNTPVLNSEAVDKLIFSTLDSMQREVLSKDKELGMPQIISSFADYPRGLVLVTGPTGSGKSTTLAAIINKINTEKAMHILTIEDPIEFTHKSKRSVVAQREVHYDTFSFSRALKSALREDPDVVLLGEMRDLETISSAITIAETGHLVFATLHTNSAAQSIDRMIDVFPAEQQPQIRSQLAGILMAVCSQRLVPAIGGGRVVAAEIMIANSAVRSIIREGKTHQLDTTIQTGANEGMQTMDRTLAKLVQQGTVTYDDAREYAVDTREFERLVKGI